MAGSGRGPSPPSGAPLVEIETRLEPSHAQPMRPWSGGIDAVRDPLLLEVPRRVRYAEARAESALRSATLTPSLAPRRRRPREAEGRRGDSAARSGSA